MWLCWLHPVESESSPTSVQAHLHAGSLCTLAGCRITDDWQPFPENVGSACSLAVHGCFTVTGLSTEASPGTAHVQNVCLRYCQTWQPGDGYQALLPPAHEEHHRNKAPRSTRRLTSLGSSALSLWPRGCWWEAKDSICLPSFILSVFSW